MANASKSLIPAMLIALGSMVFWVLVIIAAVEESDLLIGIALAIGAVIAVVADHACGPEEQGQPPSSASGSSTRGRSRGRGS